MTIGFVYWLMLLIGLLAGVMYRVYPTPASYAFPAGGLYLIILLVLLGIGVFGWPIRA